jgi:hypothetical protein
MTVSLLRPYNGYAQGAVAVFDKATEDSLVAQGLATVSAGPVTTGGFITNQNHGQAAIPAGSSSVTVTNANCLTNSIVLAVVAQAAADSTLLRVERVVCANGSFTIYGTANATATTVVSWILFNVPGAFTN